MAVNFPPMGELYPVAGVTLGCAQAHIRYADRLDLLVIALDEGATVAGVFTTNQFCAAPVTLSRAHLAQTQEGEAGIRALLINSGNANAGMGQLGLAHAQETCAALAHLANLAPTQVLPFSTGVILEALPVERIKAALPTAWANRTATNWQAAAHAIMTTDTQAKAASQQITIDGHTITLTGISKGSGMIHPNMATMLGFIATDAALTQPVLNTLIKYVADRSFNCISVDGDTSTNDSFMLIASGKASLPPITSTEAPAYLALRDALTTLAQSLAQSIVRDGEGATKFITLQIEGGASVEECRQVGYAIGGSQLVKTAFFASDPNLGRILCALGYAGIEACETDKIDILLNDVLVVKQGGRYAGYQEEDGQRIMQQNEITIRVLLGRGDAQATLWTCDLSHEYVTINADYRS